MLGVLLAGGEGTRLLPNTKVVNKHLLPIYNKPMIYYPISTLVEAGIKDIAIVVSGKSAGMFLDLLKDGKEFGLNSITYFYQNQAGGIAQALGLAENFAKGENITVILGDNCTDLAINKEVNSFTNGAHLFFKEIDDPRRYGVAEFINGKLSGVIEKPETPPSNYAVTGLYIYDTQVFEYIKTLTPSPRGELEISSLNNIYIRENRCTYSTFTNHWIDAGTHESLAQSYEYWYLKDLKQKEMSCSK